jgi:predicted alpha/beta hydrolase family esterase
MIMIMMTTFALIPGAGGMASYWRRVVPLLRDAGHEAIAISLPGADPRAGLPEYAGLVRAAIDDRDSVVLVAHSLGGFTAPLAVTPAVSAIVFVNAMIPVPGETPGDWWEATGQAEERVAAAERDGYSPEFDLATYFLHDVPLPVIAESDASYAEADTVFGSVCDFGAWPAIPIAVVASAGDRLFPVDFQRRVARERLGVKTDVVPGGHLNALSQPGPLASYLLSVTGLRRCGRARDIRRRARWLPRSP